MMKQKLLIIFYFLMTWVGVIRLFYHLNRKRKIVLTYHNVIPDRLFDNSVHLGMSHCISVFESHIKLIKRRFSDAEMNQNFLISFDDGYINQYQIASKILEKHGLRGVFFITFGLIKNQMPLIIDRVMQWISYVPVGNYQVFDLQLTVTMKNRQQVASILYEKLILNYLLWDVIEEALNRVFPFQKLKIDEELKTLRFNAMKENDLLTLASRGHIVASHSWRHLPLAILPIEMQKEDFALCEEYAQKYCNSLLYSYPYGGREEVSLATLTLCKEYGFVAAYMNAPSLVWPTEEAKYQLPRMSLPNHDVVCILDAKLSGFEYFCKNTVKTLKKVIFRFHFNSTGFQNA